MNFFFILAALLIEGLIIYGGITMAPQLGSKIVWLYGILFTFCYVGWMVPLLFGRMIKNDKAERWVGTLGIRIAGLRLFTILILLVFFLCNVYPLLDDRVPVAFSTQLILCTIILILFCLYYGFASMTGKHVASVYHREEAKKQGVYDIRMTIQNVMDEVNMCDDFPSSLRVRIEEVADKVQYISPSTDSNAVAYEQQFVEAARDLRSVLKVGVKLNEETITNYIKRLEISIANRKKY